MPDASTINIVDQSSVTHAFAFQSEKDGVFTFAKAHPDGVPIGESVLSVSVRKTPSTRKVRLKLSAPVVVTETINGVSQPRVVRVNSFDLEFTFSDTSTTAEREELLELAFGALDPSLSAVQAVVKDLESFY